MTSTPLWITVLIKMIACLCFFILCEIRVLSFKIYLQSKHQNQSCRPSSLCRRVNLQSSNALSSTPVRPTSPLSAGATLDIGHGNWEAESLLIFTPMKEDDYTSITCTVKHHGNIKGEITATHPIFVK
ncbi:hypothetical protein cypCar_00043687, partial [Cyprinus carpio]